MSYKRKQQKAFYESHVSILRTLHDLAHVAAHGHMAHDQLIRLGEAANRLVALHGHLVQRKTISSAIPSPLWPAPRNGFPKCKQNNTEKP